MKMSRRARRKLKGMVGLAAALALLGLLLALQVGVSKQLGPLKPTQGTKRWP